MIKLIGVFVVELLPLRFSSGWSVVKNNLFETTDENKSLLMNDDILTLTFDYADKSKSSEIRLSWISYGSGEGEFKLCLVRNGNARKPEKYFYSENINEISDKIGEYMLKNNHLKPLRISDGWSVMWNHFSEMDIESLDPDFEDDWLFLVQDMSLFRRFNCGGKDDIDIDLGWYPEADPNGTFTINVIKNHDWNFPEETFSSRSTEEIADKLEYFLKKYSL